MLSGLIMPKAVAFDSMYLDSAASFAGVIHMNGVIDRSTNSSGRQSAPRQTSAPTRQRRLPQTKRPKYPTPSPTSGSTSVAANSVAIDAFRYRRSAAVSAQFKQDFIAKQSALFNSAEGEQFRQTLESQEWVEGFNRDASAYGLEGSDLATAMTGYWVRAWMVVNDQQPPSQSQILAVHQQVRNVLAKNPDLRSANDAARQTLAETVIYEQSLILGLYNTVKQNGSTDVLKQLQQKVRQGFLASGMDLKTIILTEQGFEPRS
jgi:hypothetical protein